MAISYVAAGTPQDRTASNTTVWTVGTPSGVQAGDLLVALLSTGSGAVPASSGWTQIISQNYLYVLTKTATASEPATVTFDGGGGAQGRAGVIVAYRGAGTSTVYAGRNDGDNDPNSTSPGATGVPVNSFVLDVFGAYAGQNSVELTPNGSGWAQRYKTTQVSNTSAALLVLETKQAASGATATTSAYNATPNPQPGVVYVLGTSSATIVVPIYNVAPNAPTLNSPATGASLDRTLAQTFSWTPSDSDPGDTQSAFTFRYRVQGSTGAWTSVSQTTSATSYTVAANTFADSTQYEWQVATTDALGAVGPYSASNIFLAATPPPAPTITVPASGATVTAPTSPLTFTAPNVTASRWRVMGDTSGSANTTVVRPGATTNDASLRTFTVDGLTDNTSVHFQVAVQYQGLWSAWADRQVAVAFTLPAVPLVALSFTYNLAATPPVAALVIAISNPTPSGGQPAVVSHEVYVNDGDGLGSKKLAAGLAPGATYTHATPAAVREYSGGPVRVAAVAASGAKSFGTGTG